MGNKYSCGNLIPSSCVPYTGGNLSFLTSDHQPACDANIDDVFTSIGHAIDTLQKAVDVSLHTFPCGTLSSPKTAAKVLQDHSDKICALSASLAALQQIVAGENIANELVTIDLKCLASAASPCQVSTNTYSLISILNLLVTQICAIKTNLGI